MGADWRKHVKGWDRPALAGRADLRIRRLVPGGVAGDPIVQIGAIVTRVGTPPPPPRRVLFVLGSCDAVAATDLRVYEDEASLLRGFADFVREANPDLISGYNIIPFDLPYLFDRALEHGPDVLQYVTDVGRLRRDAREGEGTWVPWKHLQPLTELRDQRLSSSAFGDNNWRRFDMVGRVQLDQLVVIRKSHNLNSYKLDAVSAHFMFGSVRAVAAAGERGVRVETSDVRGLVAGDCATLAHGATRGRSRSAGRACAGPGSGGGGGHGRAAGRRRRGHGQRDHRDEGARVLRRARRRRARRGLRAPGGVGGAGHRVRRAGGRRADRWNHAKDDVPPGGSSGCRRAAAPARPARLLHQGRAPASRAVARSSPSRTTWPGNITHVPLSWVTDRGVGVKLFSLLRAGCRRRGYVMPRVYPQDPRENGAAAAPGRRR